MDTASEEQSFTELYRTHYAAIDAYVRRRIAPDQVRDQVAEVFLVAWRRFGQVPPEDPLPWLYGVARRTLANARRADQRYVRLTELLETQRSDAAADHADAVVEQMSLAAAIDQLGAKDREVLGLAFWENLRHDEAAKVLGCTRATFQVRLHRARKRLRRAVAVVSAHRASAEGGPLSSAQQVNWGGADA